jgi:hypothetical protein
MNAIRIEPRFLASPCEIARARPAAGATGSEGA